MSKAVNNHNGEINGSAVDATKSAQLGPIESPTRPWYISTKALLRMVNKVSEAIADRDRTKFDQAIFGLNSVISIIANKTASQSLVINLESTPDLVDNLDALRSDQFIILNDGADDMRGRFAHTLKELTSTIADQKKMAADFLNEKAIAHSTMSLPPSFPPSFLGQQAALSSNVNVSSSLAAVMSTLPAVPTVPNISMPSLPAIPPVSTEMITQTTQMSTTYQKTMQYLRPILEQVKVRFPKSYAVLSLAVQQLQEAVGSKCEEVVKTVKQTIDQTDVVQLMLTAQPYAHAAYTNAAAVAASVTPTITAAVDPLRPYLEPLLQRAMEARAALLAHATMGPYISYALERLYAAIELAHLYCSIGDASAAVVSALTGVPQVALPELPELPDAPEVPQIMDAVHKAEGLASHVPFANAPGTSTPQTTPRAVPQIVTQEDKKNVGKSEMQGLVEDVEEEEEEEEVEENEEVKGVADEMNKEVTEEVPVPVPVETKQQQQDQKDMNDLMQQLKMARTALNAVTPRGKTKKHPLAAAAAADK